VFLNADALPPDDLLERHLRAHRKGGPWPRHPRAVRFHAGQSHGLRRAGLAAGRLFPYERLVARRPASFDFFWTGNLSVPRAAVEAVGGFDESFSRAVWEDVELGYRLAHAGVPLVFRPDVRCEHDHAIQLDAFLRRCRWVGHEWVRFVVKHGPASFPLMGQPDPPSPSLAREFVTAVLELFQGRDAREATLREALAEIEASKGPTERAQCIEQGLTSLRLPLMELETFETMRGAAGAMLGHSPDDLDRARRELDTVEAVLFVEHPADVVRIRACSTPCRRMSR